MILTRLLIVFTKKSDDYAIFSIEAFEENLENELQTRELCGILIADKIKKGVMFSIAEYSVLMSYSPFQKFSRT